MVETHILWGDGPDHGDTTDAYTFDTEEDLEMFMWGVREATGWGDYERFPEPRIYCNYCFQAVPLPHDDLLIDHTPDDGDDTPPPVTARTAWNT